VRLTFVASDHMDSNQWPDPAELHPFEAIVEQTSDAIE
jgi:hypothetical protein